MQEFFRIRLGVQNAEESCWIRLKKDTSGPPKLTTKHGKTTTWGDHEALHPTTQQIDPTCTAEVGGCVPVVFESTDNQPHRVCLALASIPLGHQAGCVRFHRINNMGSLNTVDVTS